MAPTVLRFTFNKQATCFLAIIACSIALTGCDSLFSDKPKTREELEEDAVHHRIFYEDWWKPNTHADQDRFFYGS